MLGALMKYEFKAVGRLLLPLYGAWLIAAVFLGLSLGGDGTSESSGLMVTLSRILYVLFTGSAIIITAILLIQRFYKNLLGNEGYLMFTLPVSTGKHLINKIVSGAAWTTIGVIVAVLTGFAIVIAIEGFGSFFDSVSFFVGDLKVAIRREPSSILFMLEILVVLLVASAEIITKVYAAIAVGHQWSNHRVLGAIAGYIGFAIIEGFVGSFFDFLMSTGIFDGIIGVFEKLSAMGQMHATMIFVILVAAAVMAVYWFVCWKLLDKRLNLE